MTMADVIVEIDWASDPGDALSAATWTDVTSYVREGSILRGRRQELDEFQPGTCRLVLDNSDQRFDPNNTLSPYAPNVKKAKRVRVRAVDPAGSYSDVYDDTYGAYTQFVGYIEEFELGWRMPNDGHVTLECVDAFGLFARKNLPDSVYEYEVGVDSPDHWWRLGEPSGTVAVDVGSVGVDLTYSGSPTLGVSSLVEHQSDTAVTFDGVDDSADADSSRVSLGSQYAVEFLISRGALPGSGSVFVGRFGGQLLVALNGVNGWISVLDRDLDGKSTNGTLNLSQDTTYHVVIESDGVDLTIWVNGVDRSAAGPGTGSNLQFIDGVHLAADSDPDTSYSNFVGTLDEVAVYGAALGSARVGAHADAVDAAWNGDTSGERIGNVLDVVGWPSADRDVDSGATTFGDADLNDDQTVLQYLQRCEKSESGHFFVTRDGQTRFVERHALITETVFNASQATFDDSPTGSELPYHDLRLDYGSRVYNEVTVQRKYGVGQTVTNSTSETSYNDRSLSETGLLMDSDTEARSTAEWLLKRHREPQTVVRRILLRPRSADGLWTQVLTRDLMERVTVQFDPPGAGDTIAQESQIQGVEHQFRPMEWTTSWFLSPADTVDYLILDDPTFGKLDTNALAY